METVKTRNGVEFRLIGGYVYIASFPGAGDPSYRQICEGGGFSGSALTATEDNFKKEVARWRRQRRRMMKED